MEKITKAKKKKKRKSTIKQQQKEMYNKSLQNDEWIDRVGN